MSRRHTANSQPTVRGHLGKAKREKIRPREEGEEDLSESVGAVYIGALFADFTARHYLLLLLRRRSHCRGRAHLPYAQNER